MYARETAGIATPIGTVTIVVAGPVVESVSLGPGIVSRGESPLMRDAQDQIAAWFAGALQHFDLPLIALPSARGEALRQGLCAVGYGTTLSYGALARQLMSGARAIGQLCARNRYPIIVPCHRIVGSGGALGAYSAGEGPATKAWLIAHERAHR